MTAAYPDLLDALAHQLRFRSCPCGLEVKAEADRLRAEGTEAIEPLITRQAAIQAWLDKPLAPGDSRGTRAVLTGWRFGYTDAQNDLRAALNALEDA